MITNFMETLIWPIFTDVEINTYTYTHNWRRNKYIISSWRHIFQSCWNDLKYREHESFMLSIKFLNCVSRTNLSEVIIC